MWKQYAIWWLILFVVYGLLQDAGYVTDYLGWQLRVQQGGFLGAFHTYDYPAQLQGYALLMWLTEQLRSISTWLVHAFSVSLFAGGAVLLSRLVDKVLTDHSNPNGALVGSIAAFLFAMSPTNTEIVVWRVCPHYLVSILVWLSTLLLIRSYLKQEANKYLIGALTVQTIGLFCLELAYALPIAIFGWVVYYVFFLNTGSWRRAALAFGASLGMVVLHLLLTKAVQGVWIGHYGADVATALPFSEVIAAPWRWMSRAGIHYRFWPTPLKKGLTSALGNPAISLALYALVALLLARAVQVWLRFRKTRQTPPLRIALLLWIFLAGAGTAAVSQMYFYDFQLVENDRLGALTTVFTVAFVASTLAFLPRRLIPIVALPIILINGFTHAKALSAWSSSNEILIGLSNSASDVLTHADQSETPATVYLLSYARTYQGVPVLGDYREGQSALKGHLKSSVSGDAQLESNQLRFVDISQFHQFSLTDSVKPRWEKDELIIALDAPGSWLMHHGLGVKNRRDEIHHFNLNVGEWSIQVNWDAPPKENSIFLYQVADRFVRLPYPSNDDLQEPQDQ